MSDEQSSEHPGVAETGAADAPGDDTVIEPVHSSRPTGGAAAGAPVPSPPWLVGADPGADSGPAVVVPDIPRIDDHPSQPPPENLADPMM